MLLVHKTQQKENTMLNWLRNKNSSPENRMQMVIEDDTRRLRARRRYVQAEENHAAGNEYITPLTGSIPVVRFF